MQTKNIFSFRYAEGGSPAAEKNIFEHANHASNETNVHGHHDDETLNSHHPLKATKGIFPASLAGIFPILGSCNDTHEI